MALGRLFLLSSFRAEERVRAFDNLSTVTEDAEGLTSPRPGWGFLYVLIGG